MGDELHDVWSLFAQQYSRAEDATPRIPFVEYSIDLVRTTDRSQTGSGGMPTVTLSGTATPSTGVLSHTDVLDVFGFPAHVTALAECGELLSVTPAQLQGLYAIAQSAGFVGSYAAFTSDSNAALSALLPSSSMAFQGGCSSAPARRAWPVPLCTAADLIAPLAARWPALSVSNLSTLAALQTSIQNSTRATLLSSVFGSSRAATATDLVWAQYDGLWIKARLYARRLHAAMLAEHGCAPMCNDDLVGGARGESLGAVRRDSLVLHPSQVLAYRDLL